MNLFAGLRCLPDRPAQDGLQFASGSVDKMRLSVYNEGNFRPTNKGGNLNISFRPFLGWKLFIL